MKRLRLIVASSTTAVVLVVAGWLVGRTGRPSGEDGIAPDAGDQGSNNGGDGPFRIRSHVRSEAGRSVHARKSEPYYILESAELRPGEAFAFFQEVVARFGDDLDAIYRVFEAFLKTALENTPPGEIVAVCEAFPNPESKRRAYFGVRALCFRQDTDLEKLLAIARLIPKSTLEDRKLIYTGAYMGSCMRAKSVAKDVLALPGLPAGEDYEGALLGIESAVTTIVGRDPSLSAPLRQEIADLDAEEEIKERLLAAIVSGEEFAKESVEWRKQH